MVLWSGETVTCESVRFGDGDGLACARGGSCRLRGWAGLRKGSGGDGGKSERRRQERIVVSYLLSTECA